MQGADAPDLAPAGQVAEAGSVRVERLMEVERYSHVMHISSTVTGKLRPELSAWDALRAALPAGTVSGAPKVGAASGPGAVPPALLFTAPAPAPGNAQRSPLQPPLLCSSAGHFLHSEIRQQRMPLAVCMRPWGDGREGGL